jgi:hypothetical protein
MQMALGGTTNGHVHMGGSGEKKGRFNRLKAG